MAIWIEARIEPNVTRIVPDMAQIPQLHPNSDLNVDSNRDECGQMRRIRHQITWICHRIVGFWPNLDPNYSRIEKTWFSQRYTWVCRSSFWPFLPYSALYSDSHSDGFWEIYGHSGQIWVYSCYSCLFGWMIPVVPQLTIQISLNLLRIPQGPPWIWQNPVEFHPNISRIWLEWNLLGPYSGPYFRVYSWFWTFLNKPDPTRNIQNAPEFENSGVFAADSVLV